MVEDDIYRQFQQASSSGRAPVSGEVYSDTCGEGKSFNGIDAIYPSQSDTRRFGGASGGLCLEQLSRLHTQRENMELAGYRRNAETVWLGEMGEAKKLSTVCGGWFKR